MWTCSPSSYLFLWEWAWSGQSLGQANRNWSGQSLGQANPSLHLLFEYQQLDALAYIGVLGLEFPFRRYTLLAWEEFYEPSTSLLARKPERDSPRAPYASGGLLRSKCLREFSACKPSPQGWDSSSWPLSVLELSSFSFNTLSREAI